MSLANVLEELLLQALEFGHAVFASVCARSFASRILLFANLADRATAKTTIVGRALRRMSWTDSTTITFRKHMRNIATFATVRGNVVVWFVAARAIERAMLADELRFALKINEKLWEIGHALRKQS
jgi:hypothetical protein